MTLKSIRLVLCATLVAAGTTIHPSPNANQENKTYFNRFQDKIVRAPTAKRVRGLYQRTKEANAYYEENRDQTRESENKHAWIIAGACVGAAVLAGGLIWLGLNYPICLIPGVHY